jgi:HEAT repeat protein
MGLLDDPAVRAYAIDPLGKMRYEPAREKITALLDDPARSVRNEAKKALNRLDAARLKLEAAGGGPVTPEASRPG